MGYKQNGFLFHSSWVVDDDRIGEWPDTELVSRILATFAGEDFLSQVDQVSVRSADASPLGSFADLDALVEAGNTLPIVLFSGSEDDPDVRIHLTITRDGTGIDLGIVPAVAPTNIRDRIASWVQEWSRSLGELRCRLQSAMLVLSGSTYPRPRPRPPHEHMVWNLGRLDLYLGKHWHQQNDEARAVLANIEAAPLPASACRTSEGDVIRIAFGVDPEIALEDAAAVSAARRAQEDWLTPLIPAERVRGWNELGDRIAVVVRPAEKEPFTFYDPRYSVGYKAMVVNPESGEIDEEMWAELAKIAKDGKLPDGTEVKGVRLIFPVRENALAMRARAIADGFEMVTYPGNPQTFWQVNPPESTQ
jgi:hypothetical protein